MLPKAKTLATRPQAPKLLLPEQQIKAPVKNMTVPSFETPLSILEEKEASGGRGRKAGADNGGVECPSDPQRLPFTSSPTRPETNLSVHPPNTAVNLLLNWPMHRRRCPCRSRNARKDATAVASHVAKLLNSPKKKAPQPKAKPSKQPAGVVVNPPVEISVPRWNKPNRFKEQLHSFLNSPNVFSRMRTRCQTISLFHSCRCQDSCCGSFNNSWYQRYLF